MTREEAADILDPMTTREALAPYAYDPDRRIKVVEEACRIAAAELRGSLWPKTEVEVDDG